MKLIRNLFALIGLLAVILLGIAYMRLSPMLSELDPEFLKFYEEVGTKFLKTGDPSVAMIWAVPVEAGLTPEDVADSLKSLAASRNFLFVGESPFYKQIEAMTGQKYRYVNIFSFCDALVGKMMLAYRDEYSAFMPCRIALVENAKGELWLYAMNLDFVLHGGKALPEDLRINVQEVRDTIWEIMQEAARGEF